MKLESEFYNRECTLVAEELVGKLLVRNTKNGIIKLRISETEAYKGQEDTACHAHKGRTQRTEVLYMRSGTIYVYLCYGMHWLLNVVTGDIDSPEAVLIRSCTEAAGPGKLTKRLDIDKSFNKKNIVFNDELWIEDDGSRFSIIPDKRIGIAYASIFDQESLWRYKMGDKI